MRKIFYIDQQSYSNLAIYDHSLLSEISQVAQSLSIDFWGNARYEYKPMPNGIKTHLIFNYSNCSNPVIRFLRYFWSVICLCFNIIRYRPDVIHLQWIKVYHLDYMFLWVAKHIAGSTLIFTAHNILPHNSKNKDKKHYSRIYGIADKIIVHTETSMADFKAMFSQYASKANVVAHGILPSNFAVDQIERRAAELKKELRIEEGKTVFSMLGYQSYYKGTDIVCNAWNASHKLSSEDNILLIAGKCAADILPEMLPSNVIVINRFISDLDFLGYLKLTDVLLLPYRAIDQSGLLLTAINFSLPMCVSDVGELAKPIIAGNIGWIFDSLNEDDVKSKIEHIAESKQEVAMIKSNEDDWVKVREMYSWSESARLTVEMYRN